MSAINQLEKVDEMSQKDEPHPNDSYIDHRCNPRQPDMSIELLRIAAAAAEEAIEKVLASPPSKVHIGNDIYDVGSDEPSPTTRSSESDMLDAAPARKVSECEPDDSDREESTENSNSQETISSTSDNPYIIGDIENRALRIMTTSFSRDKWLYKQIYNLMTENAEVWRILSNENAFNLTDQKGNAELEDTMMFSQAYARVEISSTSESSLVQIVPTPVQFRMYCLDRDVPEQFKGFVFSQERTKEGYICRYGICATALASIYNIAAHSPDDRPSLLHDFALHLTKMNKCLVRAQEYHVEATQWNDFVGNAVISWVAQFPKSRMSSNFFIRRNIGVDDVIAFLQILSPRIPAVVKDAVSYQRVA